MEPDQIIACYREFAPCEALKQHVRAFFSFTPGMPAAPLNRRMTMEVVFGRGGSFCAPMFADGHASIVFDLGMACHLNGVWRPDTFRSRIIGATSHVEPASAGMCPEMVGAYLHAGQVSSITRFAADELTDSIVALDDFSGMAGVQFAVQLRELNEVRRIDRLEQLLLHRIDGSVSISSHIDIPKLAASIIACGGNVSVESLARSAGVSRQHLTRVFRECVGVSPKLYCRLARFQSGLVYASRGKIDWAQVALEIGYADQSHMIAEFREFSSLTPQQLASGQLFHPFIERARCSPFSQARSDGRYGIGPEVARTRA